MLNNEYLLSKNFLKSVEYELGPIKTANQQIPGVYYILADQEAYAVADMSPIFPKVKLYGQQIQEFLLFSMENDTSGWRIVDYEMCKYMIQHHIDPPPENLLHDLALYAAEYHPEYFGEYPVPLVTPRGYTLRHRKIANGIYWLETSKCEEMLALCYPIWQSELSDVARAIGEVAEYDKMYKLSETMGYLFFTEQSCCVPIYELMETRKEWEGTLVEKPALMNAIWAYLPDYALTKNGQEQTGKNDLISQLMREFGMDIEHRPSLEKMIAIYPDAGIDFLHLS